MKAPSKTSKPKASKQARPTPKSKTAEQAEQSAPNPVATELEGGRRSDLDGKFEADHRPSRRA